MQSRFRARRKILGSAFRVGIMPILVCLQKILAISGLSGGLKAQFLVTHGCFPKKSQLFSKSKLNLARFDTKFVAV